MEAGRESLHGGESHHHQPLELAAGPHLRPGVSHQTADGHLQADPRQQGQRSSSQCFRGRTRSLSPASIWPAVWRWPLAGLRGAGRRGPVPRLCRWDRGEDGACQHSGERGPASALCSNISQGFHSDVEMIGAVMSSWMSDFVVFFLVLFFSLGPLLRWFWLCFVIKCKTSSTGQVAGVSGSLLHCWVLL